MIREFHEVANIFPMMQGEEFDALKADIAANGLREAIWLHPDGRIIDGRNRYLACCDLGIEPEYRTWNGCGSLVAFVVSLNLHRRHLTSGQQAMIAAEVLPMLEVEAKERQGRRSDLEPIGENLFGDFVQKIEQSDPMASRSIEQAASMFSTNRQYVADAKRLMQDAPDLAEQVKTGDMKITEARRQLNQRQKAESPPLPTNKYRVIYADPPWKYSNNGAIETANGREVFTRVEQHYPTMSIEELCAMGPDVQAMTEPDAVLFLWTTSPMLEVAFDVINSWGFKYKTSVIWNKMRHTWGHYVSVRHELLLICTRGSCTPDANELPNSVQSIERSDRNSEKPEQFRQMIDQMYTYGRRIELFSRTNVDGWEVWGNEC